MSNKIEISRELVEQIAQWGSVSLADRKKLRALLAAPVALGWNACLDKVKELNQ